MPHICSVCEGTGLLLHDWPCPLCEGDPLFFEETNQEEHSPKNTVDDTTSSIDSQEPEPENSKGFGGLSKGFLLK